MGLLFQFPVEEDPIDERILIDEKLLTLKSYGLPMIFWGYLCAILSVLFFMYLAIRNPIHKLVATDDFINQLLGYSVLALLILLPCTLLSFFFYEKIIQKKGRQMTITHRLFWLPFFKKKIWLDAQAGLVLDHFIDSPNLAAQNNNPDLKGFQNRGHFQLFAKAENGKMILIDRNSRKGEMKKMLELLGRY